jgi:phosphate transport system substrate-binding protein
MPRLTLMAAWALLTAGGVLASASAAGLFPAGASYLTPEGAIRIVGYNDMQGMFEAIDALFVARHPEFTFALALTGTKAAAAALTSGQSALAPMGAEFYEEDVAAYRRAVGSYPLELRVAHDSLDSRALSSPMAIYVPAGNPLSQLTLAQVQQLFTLSPAAPPYTTWGQLGLTGAWAERPIHVYGLALNTALGYFMQKRPFGGRPYRPDLRMSGRSGEVVAKLAADPLGIGVSILSNRTAAVKIVGLVGPDQTAPHFGTREDILSGHYPYDRHLLIYVRQPVEPWIAEYLRLWLSPEGQAALAAHSPGYLPLNAAEAAEEAAKLAR